MVIKKAILKDGFLYPGWDLNPHVTSTHGPQPCLSTNSSTRVDAYTAQYI